MSARYLYGDPRPFIHPVATAPTTAIAPTDMCAVASSNAISATDWTWDTNLATTQAAFILAFLGCAAQRKGVTGARIQGNAADNLIRIDSEGVFEFDCASATFAVGDLVGPAKASGNALEPQKVAAVASESLAVGSVVEAGTSITKVKVRIRSTKVIGSK